MLYAVRLLAVSRSSTRRVVIEQLTGGSRRTWSPGGSRSADAAATRIGPPWVPTSTRAGAAGRDLLNRLPDAGAELGEGLAAAAGDVFAAGEGGYDFGFFGEDFGEGAAAPGADVDLPPAGIVDADVVPRAGLVPVRRG